MNNLKIKALVGLFILVFVLAALIFIPVWTFNYWQAWLFLIVFSISVLAVTLYLMKYDPKLLERRVKAGPGAEKQPKQKFIQSIAQFAFILVILVPAIDHRFDWSNVQAIISIIGDMVVATGLLIVFLVFRVNSFTSAIIDIDQDQKVIMTGPYAFVRHPMYSGAMVMLLGVPLALGSWWGLLTIVPMMTVIILRLIDEEKFLEINLVGYKEYQMKVKYRLLPHIW